MQSTESLHQTVAEMVDRMEREHKQHSAELAKHQRAIILAIQAYLDALSNGDTAQ